MQEQVFYIELEQSPGGAWKRSHHRFTCPKRAAEFAKAIARHHWAFGVRVEKTRREQALDEAKRLYAAHSAARIANDFHGGPPVNEADFGYRHGWYKVGEFSFSSYEITGEKYDPTQGGWAYL